MDSGAALVKGIKAALEADISVQGLGLSGIYTDVPQAAVFPYVLVSIESAPFAAADFSGQSHQVRIQAYSREPSVKECLTIRKTCLQALDRKEGSITLDEGVVVQCMLSDFSTFFKEDDGRTWQAVGELQVDVM